MEKAAVVFIFNSKNEVALQKRSLTDKSFPGCWDFSAGGGLDEGEDFHTGALRELKEEIGVTGVPITFLTEMIAALEDRGSELIGVFKAVYDGPFILDPKEVHEITFFPLEEVRKMAATQKEKFHSQFVYFMETYGHLLS